jgi:hypothetical protein
VTTIVKAREGLAAAATRPGCRNIADSNEPTLAAETDATLPARSTTSTSKTASGRGTGQQPVRIQWSRRMA